MNFCFFTIWSTIFVSHTSANMMCSRDSIPRYPTYYLIEKCHRSKLGIAAKANYTSLASCQKLAMEKKALSLNFSPPEAVVEGGRTLEYTCEVLKCSEADGGLSLVNDTLYDYYSVHAQPIPHVNSTCVPATGMFQLIQRRLNFTEAVAKCHNLTGVLANVVTEQRTDALAQMLAGASVDVAIVGMTRVDMKGYFSINGDSLDCTTYRAWAPGHPKRYPNKFGCVVLTRHRTWQSVECKKSFPVLCELIAGGPYKKGLIFASIEKSKDDKGEGQELT